MSATAWAGLTSDHLRAVTQADVTSTDILQYLENAGEKTASVDKVDPSLEDVFLALAARD